MFVCRLALHVLLHSDGQLCLRGGVTHIITVRTVHVRAREALRRAPDLPIAALIYHAC